MVAAFVAKFEIDIVQIMMAQIHERSFKNSMTYSFPFFIFYMHSYFGVSFWHCDKVIHRTGTLDIGLIKDEANVAAPCKKPWVEFLPLG